jgi:adenylate kinase
MKRTKTVIVITGVPGTGKTRISDLLAARIKDAVVVHTTEFIRAKKLFSSYDSDGSLIVQMKALERELARVVARSDRRFVILEGHVLCDLRVRGATAVVLREHLGVIRRRLLARGYGKAKMKANIVSEATDYCGAHAEENYPKVFEIFSRSRSALPDLVRIAEGRKVSKKEIDLLEELPRIIKKDRDFAI